jgi:transcriptional regulator with XRE-family HTH domain
MARPEWLARTRGNRESIIQPQTLGEALRLLQRRAGLNRDDLAKVLEISSGALSNYMNDVSFPSAPLFRKMVNVLADRLGVEAGRVWLEMGHFLDDSYGVVVEKGSGAGETAESGKGASLDAMRGGDSDEEGVGP